MQKGARNINPDLESPNIYFTGETKILNYKNFSEEEIWIEFKRGSDSALAYIYRQYANPLFNYGYHIINNDDILQDCIQDLFIYLINKRKKLGVVSAIKPYLFASLRRMIFRKLKKERKYKYTLENSLHEQDIKIISSLESKMINEQLTDEQCKLIEGACRKLTNRQREAVILYFYEGFTYKQIAKIMHNGKVKSTRVLIYRAIDALQASLLKVKSQLYFVFFLFCTSAQ